MADSKPKKRGRPVGSRSVNPANKSLSNVRVSESRLNAYKSAAKRAGKSFSAWVRDALDKEESKK